MDSDAEEIIVPFNRMWLKRMLAFYWFSALNCIICVAFAGAVDLFGIGHPGIFYQEFYGFVALVSCGFCWLSLHYLVFLQHCWTSRLPAIIINHIGILRWQDIEKMYPSHWEWIIFEVRLLKIRIVKKTSVFVIVPKDMKQLALGLPLWKSLMLKSEIAVKRNWSTIDDGLLSISANELIQQINQFFITHVQESG